MNGDYIPQSISTFTHKGYKFKQQIDREREWRRVLRYSRTISDHLQWITNNVRQDKRQNLQEKREWRRVLQYSRTTSHHPQWITNNVQDKRQNLQESKLLTLLLCYSHHIMLTGKLQWVWLLVMWEQSSHLPHTMHAS